MTRSGFGHGAGYQYPHAYSEHWVPQQYLPDGLAGSASASRATRATSAASASRWSVAARSSWPRSPSSPTPARTRSPSPRQPGARALAPARGGRGGACHGRGARSPLRPGRRPTAPHRPGPQRWDGPPDLGRGSRRAAEGACGRCPRGALGRGVARAGRRPPRPAAPHHPGGRSARSARPASLPGRCRPALRSDRLRRNGLSDWPDKAAVAALLAGWPAPAGPSAWPRRSPLLGQRLSIWSTSPRSAATWRRGCARRRRPSTLTPLTRW